MQPLLLTLAACLMVIQAAVASISDGTALPASLQTAPELDEASKLTQQLVKLHAEKKYEEALAIAKRVLELREKSLGPNDPVIAASLNYIGEIAVAQSKYSDAESAYKRALNILEKNFGPDSINLIFTLEKIALMRFAQRDSGGAEKIYNRAITISEKANGPESIQTGRLLRDVGRFYERIDKFGKAADSYKRSLAITEKALGPKHEEVVNLLYACACVLSENGKVEEATPYLDRAESMFPSEAPVQGGLIQGKAIKRVEPEYPMAARQARVRGTVVVQVLVNQCGRVTSARALAGPHELSAAATNAAKAWQFTTTRLSGRPVRVIGTITFNFTL